ncbi:MAG: phasin family protein [Robiginitomaculum sp.]
MSKDKDSKRNTGDTARRIWLAGIGAYGRAFTETKEAIKDMSGEASEVFDDLVQKGEMFEMVIGMKSKEMLDKTGVKDVKMPDIHMPDLHMDKRIKKMRDRLKASAGFDDDIPSAGLEARMDAVEAKLDEVLALLKPAPKAKAKPAAKAKKTTTTRTKAKVKSAPKPKKK